MKNSSPINDLEKFLQLTSYKSLEENMIVDKEVYTEITKKIENLKLNNFRTAQEKGTYFENFINDLIDKTRLYIRKCNVNTSTNEIDIRVELEPGQSMLAEIYHSILKEVAFIECKNYPKSKVNVTYIGKFYSLLKTSKKKLGIIISPNGLTGQECKDGHGLCKKIALKDDTNIISLTFDDLLQLNQKSLLMIIKEKLIELEEDISISNLIEPHELESNNNFKK